MNVENEPEPTSTEQNSPKELGTASAEYQFIKSPTLSNYLSSYSILLLIAGSILYLDQLTKDWVRESLSAYESYYPFESLAPFVRIINVENSGAAFGIFKQAGGLITILAIVVTLVIAYYFPRIPNRDWPIKLALGFQMGGALGNLFDRIFYGPVTDFISIGRFPVFNIADSSVTTGVSILILTMLIMERRDKKALKLAGANSVDSAEVEIGEQV